MLNVISQRKQNASPPCLWPNTSARHHQLRPCASGTGAHWGFLPHPVRLSCKNSPASSRASCCFLWILCCLLIVIGSKPLPSSGTVRITELKIPWSQQVGSTCSECQIGGHPHPQQLTRTCEGPVVPPPRPGQNHIMISAKLKLACRVH